MKSKVPRFQLDTQKHEAAQLIVDGALSIVAIAKKLGTTKQTIHRWRQRPEFLALIEEKRKAYAERLLNEGIANKNVRLKKYQSIWDRIERILEERGEQLAGTVKGMGVSTGLVCVKTKMIGGGDFAMPVQEFEVDTGLMKEMRELLKQAAQERGDWSEKVEHTGKDGGPIDVLKALPDDELELLEKLLVKAQKQTELEQEQAAA